MTTEEEPRLAGLLLGSGQVFPLEQRVLNAALLASGSITTLIAAESVILCLSCSGTLLAGTLALVFWTLFGLCRQPRPRKWPMWVYILVNIAVIPIDWFLVGGQGGIARSSLVSICAVTPFLMSRRQFPIGVLALTLVYTLLLLGSLWFWGAMPVEEENLRTALVRLFEAGILALCTIAVAYMGVNSYRRTRDRAERLNRELLESNAALESRNKELEAALREVKVLRGILPICSYCKKIRNDTGYWDQLEEYLLEHADVQMSHGICPDCLKQKEPEIYEEMRRAGKI